MSTKRSCRGQWAAVMMLVGVLLPSTTLVGCSPFIARETLPRSSAGDVAIDVTMPVALKYVEDTRIRLETARERRAQISSLAGAGVLVGAAGAAAAAAYGATNDLILGFLLGGTGSYVAGQLYGERGYIGVYNRAIEALDCIDEGARNAFDPIRPLATISVSLAAAADDLEKEIAAADVLWNGSPGALAFALSVAREKLTDARAAILYRFVVEAPLAAAVIGAVNRVVTEANAQIDLQRPDLQAFVTAAASFSTTGLSKTVADLKAPFAKTAVGTKVASSRAQARTEQQVEAERKQTERLNDATQRVTEIAALAPSLLDAQTTNNRADLSSCKLAALVKAALIVSPAGDVKIRKGQEVLLLPSGGAPPYRAAWIGTAPGDHVTASQPVGSISISVKASGNDPFAAGKTYVLRVMDTSAPAHSVDVKVITE